MRSTHTYVVLKISPAAHAEIKQKLLAAGYQHAINGETVDMHGIALEPETVALEFAAKVYADRVDFETHSTDTTWEREYAALKQLRSEISKLIMDGPLKCPVAPGHIRVTDSLRDAPERFAGITVDSRGDLHGEPRAIQEFKEFCRARPMLDVVWPEAAEKSGRQLQREIIGEPTVAEAFHRP